MTTIQLTSDRVRTTAHVVSLLTLPSGVWRIALVLGAPLMAAGPVPLGEKIGIVLLSVLLEGLALLTLGLVQPWGEVCPRWLPLIGGRRVPPLAATVPALTGAVALTLLWTLTFLNTTRGDFFSHFNPLQTVIVVACYLPLIAWGPLLAVVAIAYQRRRSRDSCQWAPGDSSPVS
jgi:hypothetical protein